MLKHINVKTPEDKNAPIYQIFIYGSLWCLDGEDKKKPYLTIVSLTVKEIHELFSLNGLKMYQKCKEIFESKYPEPDKQKKFLSEEQQLELKVLFP